MAAEMKEGRVNCSRWTAYEAIFVIWSQRRFLKDRFLQMRGLSRLQGQSVTGPICSPIGFGASWPGAGNSLGSGKPDPQGSLDAGFHDVGSPSGPGVRSQLHSVRVRPDVSQKQVSSNENLSKKKRTSSGFECLKENKRISENWKKNKKLGYPLKRGF
ncbi:hypothetical protein NE237_032653 [Protea cynaroides]|uniref:Uncharacterized protein n=1 Tax=Protea cynaroides TaxID=273540 RepID=A0A9Q0L4U5_9MAGN|nr:hypothetical protein NE237_032653 [Protea cynaroides]